MDRTTVGRRYQIERKIGEGGTAEVYLALDPVLGREVALKWLRPQYAADRGFRSRFEREAQAAARLSHPNIIAIFDVGEDRGIPFIVMEHIEGETLADIIADEAPLHPDDVAILMEQVGSALDFAHARGIVHRDIKPHNILVDSGGLVKVVDFGIAKGLSDSPLTQSGTAIGTAQYISPEQASGLMATPESDIYSLAVVAFQMVTGVLPFNGETTVGIAVQHITDPPPDPSDLSKELPHEVADIILRGLEKNPTRRYGSAGEFARVLTAWRSYTPEDWKAARIRAVTGAAPRISRPVIPLNDASVPAPAELRHGQADGPPIAARRQPEPSAREPEQKSTPWRSAAVGGCLLAVIGAVLWFGIDLGDRLGLTVSETAVVTPRVIAVPPSRTAAAAPTPQPSATARPTPAMVSAPDLAALPRAAAQTAAARAGLTLEDGGEAPSESVAAGSVASQSPASKSPLQAGGSIRVVFSSGPPAIDLSTVAVAGSPAAAAARTLTTAGLNVQQAPEGSATVAEGSVIRVDPEGTVKKGDSVTLYVSMGDKVQIPVSLQGQPLSTVTQQLQTIGLTVGATIPIGAESITSRNIDLAQAGIEDQDVVGIQDGGATFGGWVERGATVTLVYYAAAPAQPTIDAAQ